MIRDENAVICAVVDSGSDRTGNEKILYTAINIYIYKFIYIWSVIKGG